MSIKEQCKKYADELSHSDYREEKELFIGMYNCLNDASPFNANIYKAVINRYDKVSSNKNHLSAEMNDVLLDAKHELETLIERCERTGEV